MNRFLPALLGALLAACGGGSSDTFSPTAPGVDSATAGPAHYGEPILITLNGRNLDRNFLVQAAGCNGLTLSREAPNVSTATTAYFTCTPATVNTIRFIATRESDGVLMAEVPFTVQPATVTGGQITGTPNVGQPLLITLQGTELLQPLAVTATGCGALRRSTTEPYRSTQTTAYYRCIPTTTGALEFVAARQQDGTVLTTLPYTVPTTIPVPEVTLTFSNGAGVSGDVVIQLEAEKAPITVGNFLQYVQDGFYVDTAIHRLISDFVAQGGGYAQPLDPTATTLPTLKPVYPAIVLEDDKGLLNLQWTLSMARTSAPNSATSQFFINLVDNPNLDRNGNQRGYAVFGRIIAGTDVVTAMIAAPCSPWPAFFGTDPACVPVPNVVITRAVQTN